MRHWIYFFFPRPRARHSRRGAIRKPQEKQESRNRLARALARGLHPALPHSGVLSALKRAISSLASSSSACRSPFPPRRHLAVWCATRKLRLVAVAYAMLLGGAQMSASAPSPRTHEWLHVGYGGRRSSPMSATSANRSSSAAAATTFFVGGALPPTAAALTCWRSYSSLYCGGSS